MRKFSQMSLLLPMQHIHISAHAHHIYHTQSDTLTPIFLYYMYILWVLLEALIEFSLRPTDWVLPDWLFCPCFPVFCLFYCVCLICSSSHKRIRKWRWVRGSFLSVKACWQWVYLVVRINRAVLLALFAPELSANRIQMFLIRKESALVYNLCCSVAEPLAKLFLYWSLLRVIYPCMFMTTSHCQDDCNKMSF